MGVLEVLDDTDVVELNVEVLVNALQRAADLDVVLELDRDLVVDERLEEAVDVSRPCASPLSTVPKRTWARRPPVLGRLGPAHSGGMLWTEGQAHLKNSMVGDEFWMSELQKSTARGRR